MERNNETNLVINWQAIIVEARRRRKEQKISQKRLAALTGLSTPTISRFENGEHDIQVSTALTILKALGMSS